VLALYKDFFEFAGLSFLVCLDCEWSDYITIQNSKTDMELILLVPSWLTGNVLIFSFKLGLVRSM